MSKKPRRLKETEELSKQFLEEKRQENRNGLNRGRGASFLVTSYPCGGAQEGIRVLGSSERTLAK